MVVRIDPEVLSHALGVDELVEIGNLPVSALGKVLTDKLDWGLLRPADLEQRVKIGTIGTIADALRAEVSIRTN